MFDIEMPQNKTENQSTQQAQGSQGIDLPDIEIGQPVAKSKISVEPDLKSVAVKFGVIGTGQGGSKLADTFWQTGYRKVCAVNTTDQDFLGLSIPTAKQLVLEGDMGAGKDPSKGQEALKKSSEKVLNLMRFTFGEDVDWIMVTVGCGGGSGSGSVFGLVSLAKYYLRQLGKEEKVGVMATLPKKTEGGKVQANAYHTIKALQPLVEEKKISPFILVDNESINQMFPDVSAKSFWSIANRNIIGLFDVFNVLACQQSSYVTFDRADYKTMLNSGTIIFGATALDNYRKDTDISDGLRTNLERTLLADLDLSNASHVAAILCAPDAVLNILPQSHIDLAFTTLERIIGGENRDLTVHQGVYETKKAGLFLYTMVGGLKIPEKRLEIMKHRAGL
jgi:cell division GTPase FtsZ